MFRIPNARIIAAGNKWQSVSSFFPRRAHELELENLRGRPAYSPRTGIIVDSQRLVAKHIVSDAANHHDPTNSFSSACQQVMNATDNRRYGIAAMFAGSGWTTKLCTPWSICAGWHAPLNIAKNLFEPPPSGPPAMTTKPKRRPRQCHYFCQGQLLSPGVEPRQQQARALFSGLILPRSRPTVWRKMILS
jgi:hypothetical protein